MFLHFRTKRNVNGHCKYLGIDTDKKQFARESNGWISREYPEVTAAGYNEILSQLKRAGWEEIERI